MFFDWLKVFFDTFGKELFMPVIIFVICLIFGTPVKKSFSSAVLVGVGLKGMAFITSAFGGILSPLVQQIVDTTGLNLPALDIGWQAVAGVAYSTNIGMMFIGVGLIFQIVLWLVKVTDIFMPSDLWNNYSIIVWGSLFYQLMNNLVMAFVLMLFVNLVTLLLAETVQKRWSIYYGYPNCAMTAPHHMGDVPMYLVLNILLGKIGLDKVRIDPETIKKKIGFLGEPMYIGLIVGILLGVVGLGHIGKLVAKKAAGIGMKQILAYDPYVSQEALDAQGLRVTLVSQEELFRRSDIVSLHMRLTPETKNSIGAEQLGWMKPTAYLINTSRAGVLDKDAFVAALQSRSIGGAALDVFWEEPVPADDPLLALDNLTMTPHTAGNVVDALPKSPLLLAKVIQDYWAAGRSDMVVNQSALKA